MIDAALRALLDELEGIAERRALQEQPYDDDPELAFEDREPPSLPYKGEVPEAVLARAKSLRRRR